MKNHNHSKKTSEKSIDDINALLDYLKLTFIQEHYEAFVQEASQKHWTHLQFLSQLLHGETLARQDRSSSRRVRLAKFPIIKTLDQFNWSWPDDINRLQVQDLFRLQFLEQTANVIFLGREARPGWGGVGLGKTHLSIALGHQACLSGHSVLFSTAIDVINALSTAQQRGHLAGELRRFLKPRLLILDELGYLPIDKIGADLLFQIISQRYERGSLIITSNRPYKKWAEIFNHDSTLTSALLDRLLHYAHTITIKGKSFRMKDAIDIS